MGNETDATHEAAVEAFLKAAAEKDPDRVADVEQRYPVLSDEELEWRRSREVRLSDAFANTLALSADLFGRRLAVPTLWRRVRVALAAA